MTILIVEDEPAIRDLMQAVLRQKGHEVFAAGDGNAARQIWSQSREAIEVAVCDAYLGREHGTELCEMLKADKPELRVIICSGAARDNVNTKYEYLPKPFTPSDLLNALKPLPERG